MAKRNMRVYGIFGGAMIGSAIGLAFAGAVALVVWLK